MSRTVTRLGLGVVAGGLVVALSACSPVLTKEPYAASDGSRVTWELEMPPIKGENMLVLASAAGAEGRLVGGLTNSTNEEVTVTFGFTEGETQTVTIDPSSTVLLNGSAETDVLLPDVPVEPGALAEMVFATPSLGSQTLSIPVLDGTLPEYAELVP